MTWLILFLLLFLNSCLVPLDSISQICKVPENTPNAPKFSMAKCNPQISNCPAGDNQFCEQSYPRELGFWYHCAPSNLGDACQKSVCTSEQQKPIPNFSTDLICKAATLSQLVYHSKSQITDALKDKKNLAIYQSSLASITYAVYEDDAGYHIGIQGSESTCEWSLALGGSLETEPTLFNMRLHKGFLMVAKEINSVVTQLIPAKASKSISITGHSLGGAVSAILAMQLVNQGYIVSDVVVFGQPQVTDLEGVQLFEQHFSSKIKFTRIVNENDIAPYFLWITDNSYVHFGREMRIGKASDGTLKFALLEIPDGTLWTDELDFSKIADHAMDAYQKNLATLFGPGCDGGL